MAQAFFELLYELCFLFLFSFCLIVSKLLRFLLFFPQHEDHQHLPFTSPEFSRHRSNASSSLASSNASSSSNLETEHVKSSIKIKEPLQVICEICVEAKRVTQMIKNKACDHSYCSDCLTKHVATKIQETITVVSCPGLGCKNVFELEACRPWLPKDLIERWDQALCEALFLEVPKFYCPFKDCSTMMLVENEIDRRVAGETECPVCHRTFCTLCNVPWHSGVNCGEYQKLNENERQREDLLLRKLAKENKWQRCPKCKFYVERKDGCLHITCRCKYEFCYTCGKKWTFHRYCQGYSI